MGDEEMNEEFELLKRDAQEMGVKFRSDIGQDKLQERVDAKLAEFAIGEDTPVGSNELPVVEEAVVEPKEAEVKIESDPEPEPVEQDVSEGEAWVDRVAMAMLNKGHGQRNVLLRACAKAGIGRAEGYDRFTAAKGKTMRERLIAMFE